ncbi:hypothetical protein A9Q81_11670 [Gammaproteobacteria bacterium 42_54_T18]|nr:hypothetical protein A9Q81_11670 [Gammaproteobacteria bacterium 42_54_T18]
MTTIAIEGWLTHVLPDVSGCPEAVVLREVKNSLIEFCRRTQIWQFTADAIPLVAGIADYELDVPTGSSVAQVMSVKVDGRGLTLATGGDLDARQPGWRDHEGGATHYVVINSAEILLNRKPKEFKANALTASFALMPDQGAIEVESFLFDDWYEVIAAGAKKRLLMSPGKAWSNPGLAGVYAQEFAQGIADGKSRAQFGWGNRDLRVKKRRVM